MIDFIFDKKYINRYYKTNVSVEVVSQIKLLPNKIEAISGLVKPTSQATSKALINYKYSQGFFEL
jgi:hypothetical protein